MPDRMPDRMPEDMPEDMPDRMPNKMPEDMSDRMPQDLPVRKCINVMVGITRSRVIFFGRRPLPFGGSHLRLPSGPAGIRTTTGSLSALARPTPYQLSQRAAYLTGPLNLVKALASWISLPRALILRGRLTFFFSGMADVALRLGPYMSISS